MRRLGFIMLALLIWLTPAFIAGLTGWSSVWGGGSAFSDLLLPIPISGGFDRLPTFILVLILIGLVRDAPDHILGFLRAAGLGAALLGVVMMLDLERLYLFLTTDIGGRMIDWEQYNYTALSLAVDGAWLFALSLRRLLSLKWAVVALAAAVFLPGAYITRVFTLPVDAEYSPPGSWFFTPIVRRSFRTGGTAGEPALGKEGLMIWTRRSVEEPGFRTAAREFAERHSFSPQRRRKAEAVAVYFTDSLRMARRRFVSFEESMPGYYEDAENWVLATLCMYEDGTPDRWGMGKIDCFSDYSTFKERFRQFASEYRSVYPSDIASYLTMRRLCEGVELPSEANDYYASVDFCGRLDLQARRARLLENYSEAELQAMLDETTE